MDRSYRSAEEKNLEPQALAGLEQTRLEHTKTVQLSIIVPTRNESKNVASLLERIGQATKGLATEVIFVDDSTDNTPQVIESEAKRSSLDVAIIARPLERRNGLGKAVVEGMRLARADWVCVMDGDLQHPPEVIPQLLHHAYATNTTLVAASRLTEGGSTAGLSFRRKIISYVLAFGSRIVFPKQLRQITDPLTGFFLFRRDTVNPDDLQPEGFKILLEVLVRSPRLRVSEVPFEFAERQGGESKASSNEAVRLFRQMLRLSVSSHANLIRFLLVGFSGIFVNTLLMALFTESFNLLYVFSAILATQGSSLWNFTLTEKWVFGKRGQDGKRGYRLLGYMLVNNTALVLRGPILVMFVRWFGIHYLTANVLSLLILTMIRYFVSDRVIWKQQPSDPSSDLPLSNSPLSNSPLSNSPLSTIPISSVQTEQL
jgi:dolichol-phosphate mannosyltransferase